MSTQTLHLSKFDVAERQLNQAIVLFFEEADPVSIHTLAEAASQVLYDIRDQFGAKSIFRDTSRIKDEYKKEWTASLSSSKNFFKHADRDGLATHEFKEDFNHFSIMEALNMYLVGKQSWTPETITFLTWFTLKYPSLLKEGTPFSHIVDALRSGSLNVGASQRSFFRLAIKEMRSGRQAVPGVSLSAGLPN